MSHISLCGRHLKSPLGGNSYISAMVYDHERGLIFQRVLNVGVYDKTHIYNTIMEFKERFGVDEIRVSKNKKNKYNEILREYLDLFL